MRVKFWGTRGSISTPGTETGKYGGNTACVEIDLDDGSILIIDGGMGLRKLGEAMMRTVFGGGKGEGHILFSHTHWDHIQGIPFFPPMYVPGNRFTIYGRGGKNGTIRKLLSGQMNDTYCPVPNFLDKGFGANIEFKEIEDGTFKIGAATITAREIPHVPSVVCLGYRISDGKGTVAHISDVEYLEGTQGSPTIEMAQGADILIHDAQYTPEEYPAKRTWGHSHTDHAVEIATSAGAKHVLFFHHDPEHTDAFIDGMVRSYRQRSGSDDALEISAAAEGGEYWVGPRCTT